VLLAVEIELRLENRNLIEEFMVVQEEASAMVEHLTGLLVAFERCSDFTAQ
jgi:hypothetical protein